MYKIHRGIMLNDIVVSDRRSMVGGNLERICGCPVDYDRSSDFYEERFNICQILIKRTIHLDMRYEIDIRIYVSSYLLGDFFERPTFKTDNSINFYNLGFDYTVNPISFYLKKEGEIEKIKSLNIDNKFKKMFIKIYKKAKSGLFNKDLRPYVEYLQVATIKKFGA